MMPVVPGGIPSVPRLTVMPPSSSSSSPSAPTPVALVPNIAAGNNSITIQVKSLISDLNFHCLKCWCIIFVGVMKSLFLPYTVFLELSFQFLCFVTLSTFRVRLQYILDGWSRLFGVGLVKSFVFWGSTPVEVRYFTPLHTSPEVHPAPSGPEVNEKVKPYPLCLHVILQGELFNFLKCIPVV